MAFIIIIMDIYSISLYIIDFNKFIIVESNFADTMFNIDNYATDILIYEIVIKVVSNDKVAMIKFD
jgi:hypothetical protein